MTAANGNGTESFQTGPKAVLGLLGGRFRGAGVRGGPVRELGQFVYDDHGKPGAIDGAHDDRVFALALAVQMGPEHRHASSMPVPPWQAEDTGSGL